MHTVLNLGSRLKSDLLVLQSVVEVSLSGDMGVYLEYFGIYGSIFSKVNLKLCFL